MNLSGLLTGIGQAGSDVAQAKLDANALKLKDLFDKLGLQQGQTNLAESQERLKKLQGNPELEKANQTMAAFKALFGRDPTEQEKGILFGVQPLPSATSQVKTPFELWQKEHPTGTAEEFQKFQSEGKEKPDKAVKVEMTGDIATQVIDADGKTWRAHDPALPDELKQLVKDKEDAALSTEKRKAGLEAQKFVDALKKAQALGDIKAQQDEYKKIRDLTLRGINGHGFLRTVSQEVAAAEASSGRGTKYGDLNITEGFMQLMFGVNPKALRGSPAMVEMMLKQAGGWDDRAIAEVNKAISGGRLSQAVRQQIQEAATRQVEAWDYQVKTSAELSEDPKIKALMEKYNKVVVGDVDSEAQGLGGRPH
jgi:hypothetical protein